MTRSAAGNRFRTRKLSTKQSLAIVRESQIDSVDDDAQRSIPQIDTGVERQEEIEHHLQAAISAAQAAVIGGNAAQIYIPTPDASKTVVQYEALYPKRFSQPSSYIRFSSTVEDCSGTTYCMDSDDDKFLQKLNSTKRSTGSQCSEDTFEEVMQQFEDAVALKQPYLSMDVSQILSYEELELAFDESMSPAARAFAKFIYSHWKEQRVKRGGRPIMPILKFEQGQDKDEADPYVCFRRREVRQVRKTRRTDAQSTEKLKKLRQEMEMARAIVADVLAREKVRKEAILANQNIFELRASVKEFKRKHGIKGDDEDLYDSSKSRKPTLQAPPPHIRTGQTIVRAGPEMRPPEAELTQLSEAHRKKIEKWRGVVETGQNKRLYSNIGLEDITEFPIVPTLEQPAKIPRTEEYRAVQTYFLPSPPPSASPVATPSAKWLEEPEPLSLTVQTKDKVSSPELAPEYRCRYGRVGRLFVDRKNMPTDTQQSEIDPIVLDRFKYDNDFDDQFDEDLDGNNKPGIYFRRRLLSPPAEALQNLSSRRQGLEQMAAHGHLPSPQAARTQ